MRGGSESTLCMSHSCSEPRLREFHIISQKLRRYVKGRRTACRSAEPRAHLPPAAASPCQRPNRIWKDGISTGIMYRFMTRASNTRPASQIRPAASYYAAHRRSRGLRPSRNESLCCLQIDYKPRLPQCMPTLWATEWRPLDYSDSELITCVTDHFYFVINFTSFTIFCLRPIKIRFFKSFFISYTLYYTVTLTLGTLYNSK